MVVSEYGVADLRGATDEECIERMLGICDARFIEGLANEARRAGKLPRDWKAPDHYQRNRPEWLKEQLAPWRRRELLPMWPFGCDFDAVELRLMGALKWLKAATASKQGRLFSVARAFTANAPGPAEAPYLARMGLSSAQTFKDRILARLVSLALRQAANG